jgi:hypothetical protein
MACHYASEESRVQGPWARRWKSCTPETGLFASFPCKVMGHRNRRPHSWNEGTTEQCYVSFQMDTPTLCSAASLGQA